MGTNQNKTVVLDVVNTGMVWQAKLRARHWTTIFAPCRTYAGAIVSANNFIRTHKLIPANRNKVSKNYYNVKEI